MELTNEFLYNRESHNAMIKLGKAPLYGSNLSNLIRIRTICKKQFSELQKKYTALVKAYAEVDEKGELKKSETGDFKIQPDKIAEFNEKVQALMAEKFELPKCRKIPIDTFVDFPNLGLSASDLESLEALLDGLDETPTLPSESDI